MNKINTFMWSVSIVVVIMARTVHDHINKRNTISMVEVGKELGITKDYVDQLVRPMIRAGILESVRGRNGGIMIASDKVACLTVADIERIIDTEPNMDKFPPAVANVFQKSYYELCNSFKEFFILRLAGIYANDTQYTWR